MAIKPICDKCRKELDSFGGLIISPPLSETAFHYKIQNNKVDGKFVDLYNKYHLCTICWEKLIKWLSKKS